MKLPLAAESPTALFARMAALIGREATARLRSRFGGTRIYVPSKPARSHAISIAIGMDGARRLSSKFGGQYVRVPMRRIYADRDQDEAQIFRLRAHGVNTSTIARAVGCSERHIYDVVAAPRR